MKFDELFLVHFNPIKAGGSESMYRLGGRLAPPPPTRKRP